MKKTNSSLQGMLLLAFAQSMVGLNIVFAKQLITSLPILALLAIRFTLASLILLGLHCLTSVNGTRFEYHMSQLNRKDWYFLIAQSLCAGIFFNCLMLLGLHSTDANVAGIITSTLPVIIALMSWFILREKITRKIAICIFFAAAGLFFIAFNKLNMSGLRKNHSFIGDFVVLLSLLPEAAYYVLCKLHYARLPVFIISALMNIFNAIFLLPFVFFHFNLFTITFHNWMILILLALTSGFFYVFWHFGSQRITGAMASLSTAIMPVSTVLFAWIFLGERLSLLDSLGMTLIVFSIIISTRK